MQPQPSAREKPSAKNDLIDDLPANEDLKGNDLDRVLAGQVHGSTIESRAAALKLAQRVDPGPKFWSLTTAYFSFIVLSTCLCAGDNGFDGTVMSQVNSMTQYQGYFGLEAASKGTSLVFGIYTVGQVIAFFPLTFMPDTIGRRWCMLIGNAFLVTGSLVTGFAKSRGPFIGGRLLTGFGCTIAVTAAKMYLAEITSPATRGRFVGALNCFYLVGQLLAGGIAIPSGRWSSEYSWRLPLLVQAIPAFFNILTVPFLPESPRWLYVHGHHAKAAQVLANLHSRSKDPNSPLISLQISEIEEFISAEGDDKRFWNFKSIFRTRADRYRFGLCAIVSMWGQVSGNGLINYFFPIVLGQAGIKSPDRQRVLTLVQSVTTGTLAFTGSALLDHLGRRPLMLFSSLSNACLMSLIGGLLSDKGKQNHSRSTAGIVLLYFFQMFFAFGWTNMQALYPTEVLSYENRGKGLALQGLMTNAFTCINTFGLPSALAAISWKVYFLYSFWDFVGLALQWVYIVETKRLSLEDLDEVFQAPNPRRKSLELAKTHGMGFRKSNHV